MMSKRRVAITGMGVVSPIGNDVQDTWRNVVAGRSGVERIDSFDTSDFSVRIAATIKGLDTAKYMAAKETRRFDPFVIYGMIAGIQAIEESGLTEAGYSPERIGVSMGSGIGGIATIGQAQEILYRSGPRRISPFCIPGSIANMVSGNLSIRYGIKGPNLSLVTACTTATHNIGIGARLIRYGEVDAMIVGGSEAAIHPIPLAAFASMKALSVRNEEPEMASRPWDRSRDGFVLGDGAGVLVIEEYESARRRGANIYAELAGFGMSADAHHITSPPPDGAGAVSCMKNALQDAGISTAEVDYINAHGTSTPLGDLAETIAIKTLFGADTRVAVSSSKSMFGHLMGAAGAVEAMISVLSIRDNVVPPTINLDDPGAGCDLDYVPHTARQMKDLRIALSNSFGFGGTNGSLVFRQPD